MKNLNFYGRAKELVHEKISLIRDFSQNVVKKAKDFFEYGEYAEDIKALDTPEIEDKFIDDGYHFKQAELEMLVEGEFKSIIIDYKDTEDQVGFTLLDIEALKRDLCERYNNDPHTGVIRYRLLNSENAKNYTPFVEPRKSNGLTKYVDLEYMIDNEVQTVTLSADATKDGKGFAIRDMKDLDRELKKTYGHDNSNGILRFKLYSNAYEYNEANYVYMNANKIMTHSDVFQALRNDETFLGIDKENAYDDPIFLTFMKWLDFYKEGPAKIPRYVFYNNGIHFPLSDDDRVYYYEIPEPKKKQADAKLHVLSRKLPKNYKDGYQRLAA